MPDSLRYADLLRRSASFTIDAGPAVASSYKHRRPCAQQKASVALLLSASNPIATRLD